MCAEVMAEAIPQDGPGLLEVPRQPPFILLKHCMPDHRPEALLSLSLPLHLPLLPSPSAHQFAPLIPAKQLHCYLCRDDGGGDPAGRPRPPRGAPAAS